MKLIEMLHSQLLLIFFILFLSTYNFAINSMQDDKKVDEVTSILKQKVLLSNDQEIKVKQILNELQSKLAANSESKTELIGLAQSKIESLLDKKQKLKYDIIKNEIWKNF